MKQAATEARYLRWTENNDYEGETWNFYIPVDGNEEAIEELRKKLNQLQKYLKKEECIDCPYVAEGDFLPETVVDNLVKYANGHTSYNAAHTKLSGRLDVEQLRKLKGQDLYDALYKSRFLHHMNKEK